MSIEVKPAVRTVSARSVGLWSVGAMAAAAMLVAGNAYAISPQETIQPVSLQVKQRIQAIEQINVTAEKPVDESAPRASAEVEALLRELDELHELEEQETADPAQ